jgi:hypothetical protein
VTLDQGRLALSRYTYCYVLLSFGLVIVQFVVRIKGLSLVGQTGVTGTYPTQCYHDGKVLSV